MAEQTTPRHKESDRRRRSSRWPNVVFVAIVGFLFVGGMFLPEDDEQEEVAVDDRPKKNDKVDYNQPASPEAVEEIHRQELDWIANMRAELRGDVVFAVNSERVDRFPPEVREVILARLEPFLSVEGNSFTEHGWLLDDHADGRHVVILKATMKPADGEENSMMEMLAVEPDTLQFKSIWVFRPGEGMYPIFDGRLVAARRKAKLRK